MVNSKIKKQYLIISFVSILLIFSLYIYKMAIDTQNMISKKIEESKIEDYMYYFKNYNEHLIKVHNIKNRNDLFLFFKNKQHRHVAEAFISTLNTPSSKYIYILQKDKSGRFRFLLDASKDDKAHFYQKFDVNKREIYDKLYETKKPQIIRQNDLLGTIYITYLYPIIAQNEVIAVASVDLDIKLKKDIKNILKPYEYIIKFFIWVITFIILVVILQTIYLYISNKNSLTDPLTKIFNRKYLNKLKGLNLQNYAICMMDLDKFKAVNDTYGHLAGDYVLATFANICKNSIRDEDILIRYGGEEFLLLLKHTGKDKPLEICERIRKNVENYDFYFENHHIKETVSMGLITNTKDNDLQKAIELADKNLYISKNSGRNRITYNKET